MFARRGGGAWRNDAQSTRLQHATVSCRSCMRRI